MYTVARSVESDTLQADLSIWLVLYDTIRYKQSLESATACCSIRRTEVKAIAKYDNVILQPGHEGAQWMSVFKRMIASLHTCHAQLMVIGS